MVLPPTHIPTLLLKMSQVAILCRLGLQTPFGREAAKFLREGSLWR